MQLKNSDIAHSLSNQLTYVKDLSTSSKINADAIANLSSTVKDQIIQSQGRFFQIVRDVSWLNSTLYDQTTMYTHS